MIHTLASIHVQLLDWVAFSIQHAFSDTISAILASLLAAAFIVGISFSGRLWNKKWSPFGSGLLNLIVCVSLMMLFWATSISLHGLSNNKYGIALSSGNAVSCIPLDAAAENFQATVLQKLQGNSLADPLQVILSTIENQQLGRWTAANEGNASLTLIRSLVSNALKADRNMRNETQSLAEELADNGEAPDTATISNALTNFNNSFYKKWCEDLDAVANYILECYRNTVLCMSIIWFSLIALLLAYVSFRAYTDIKVLPPAAGNKPSDKVERILLEVENASEEQES